VEQLLEVRFMKALLLAGGWVVAAALLAGCGGKGNAEEAGRGRLEAYLLRLQAVEKMNRPGLTVQAYDEAIALCDALGRDFPDESAPRRCRAQLYREKFAATQSTQDRAEGVASAKAVLAQAKAPPGDRADACLVLYQLTQDAGYLKRAHREILAEKKGLRQ
jgi:hypothetical protein